MKKYDGNVRKYEEIYSFTFGASKKFQAFQRGGGGEEKRFDQNSELSYFFIFFFNEEPSFHAPLPLLEGPKFFPLGNRGCSRNYVRVTLPQLEDPEFP